MLDLSLPDISNKISFLDYHGPNLVFVKFPLHFVHNGQTPCSGIRDKKAKSISQSSNALKQI